MPKIDSRELILRAAKSEFAEHGFAGARVDRIARSAGLNKQLIYYYFGSKQALLAAATSAAATVEQEGLQASPATASAGIHLLVGGLLQSFSDHPEVVALLVDRGATGEGRAAGRAWIARAQREAATALSRGQGLGHFRDDVDPEATARAVVVLCLGFLALAPHLDATLDDWSREVSELLARVTAW